MKHFSIFLLSLSPFIARFIPIAITNKNSISSKAGTMIHILEGNDHLRRLYPTATSFEAKNFEELASLAKYEIINYAGSRLTAKGAVVATILTYLPIIAVGISGGLGYGVYEVTQKNSNIDIYS